MKPSRTRSAHLLGGPARLPKGADEIARLARAAWAKRRPLLARTEILRAVHGEADGLPGLAVDWAAGWAVLHWYGTLLEFDARRDALLPALAAAVGARGVYLKVRPPEASKVREAEKDALCPAAPVRGEPAPEELVAREGDLRFALRLGEGFSYGVFPDQRDNRARVRKAAKDRRVLNLFAYTGGFTVAAALGGAEGTVTVDAAAPACRWAERNLVLNGFAAGGAHRIVRADAFDFLRRAAKKGERYDLVVCDPPGFATVGRKRWSAERDLAALVALCAAALAPGGEMLVTVNLHSMPEKAFASAVAEGLGPGAGFATYPPPRDFPAAGGQAHLKTAWARAT